MALTQIILDQSTTSLYPVNEGDTVEFTVLQTSTTIAFESGEPFSPAPPSEVITVNAGDTLSYTFTGTACEAYPVFSSAASEPPPDSLQQLSQPTLVLIPLPVPVTAGSSPVDSDVIK